MPQGFTSAMAKFFGRKEGQTLPEFAAELRTLTPDDRVEFANGLRINGYDIDEMTVNPPKK